MAGVVTVATAAELQRDTTEAWQEYIRQAGIRLQSSLEGSKPFLWADGAKDRALRVRRGEVVVAPFAGHGTQAVPNGLIHDWIGAIYLPGVTIDSVLAVVHDYERYKDIYRPVVTDSRSLDAGKTEQEFSMVWQRHVLFVNAAVQGHYRAHDVLINPQRGYSVVDAVSLQQIEDYGRPGQHLLPANSGTGLIWNIHSAARYEERDGGVYLEIEVIVLSRDIPSSLRWLVNPVVNRLSMSSLTTTLQQTRGAVTGEQSSKERVAVAERKRWN
jgi:hypothetical protein